MDLQTTLAVFAISIAATVFCGWRGARTWNVLQGPRLVPWRFLMLLAFTCALISGAYAMELMGIRAPKP
jgi:hypothetical protein